MNAGREQIIQIEDVASERHFKKRNGGIAGCGIQHAVNDGRDQQGNCAFGQGDKHEQDYTQ
jgi:hypothetical protein